MTSAPPRVIPHRPRMLLLGIAVPMGVAAVVAAVLRSWIPELPDPVAIHWGLSGPDDLASPDTAVWWALVVVAPAVVCTILAYRWGEDVFTRRMALAGDWFLTTLFTVLLLGLLGAQRGLANALDVGGSQGWIGLALILGVVAGVAGWFLIPGDPPSSPPGALDPATRHLPLAADERVLWTATVRQRGVFPVVTIVCLVAAVIAVASSSLDSLFVVILGYAGLLVPMSLFTSARVVVDGSGMRVTLGPGVRARTIDARQIQAVDVVDVRPLREFGGWGIRTGRHGVVGVVLHAGPSIQVTMSDGRRFLATVPDAETGAAVLAGVALRTQAEAQA